jgi:hypothetical protein
MAFADMNWTAISIHCVVLEFLRAEREKHFSFYPPWLPLIDNPNPNDPMENHRRLRLSYLKRAIFMFEIPPDTQWYEVHSLTENEADELYVAARYNPQWDAAGNKLDKVAGPFTIVEGNHRMLAWAHANPRPQLNISVYVGLSPSYCCWHFADPVFKQGDGLINAHVNIEARDNWLFAR